MKKFFLSLAAVVLSAGLLSAQDLGKATETANSANDALVAGNYEVALSGFQEALALAQACGEEGATLTNTCKGVIPKIILSLAKENIKAAAYDNAVAKLNEAVAVAKEYGVDEVAEDASALIGQTLMAKGTALLKAKDFAGAAAAYKMVVDADPTNGMAALRLGQALANTTDAAGAIAALEVAAANGQEENANKQLSTIYLKKAAASLKSNAHADAIESALKAVGYAENPQAYMIAGQASQKTNKTADAIKYFEKYLELSPTAKNANTIAYTVGALYQKSGNNAKAKEFYQKVANDPTLGPQVKPLIDALK